MGALKEKRRGARRRGRTEEIRLGMLAKEFGMKIGEREIVVRKGGHEDACARGFCQMELAFQPLVSSQIIRSPTDL